MGSPLPHRILSPSTLIEGLPAFAMLYRMASSVEGQWSILGGTESLPKVIAGVRIEDGIQVVKRAA